MRGVVYTAHVLASCFVWTHLKQLVPAWVLTRGMRPLKQAYGIGGGWENKWDKMVWRGRDSNELRVKFVDEIATRHAHLIDAKISKNQMNYYPSEQDRLNDKLLQAGKKVPLFFFVCDKVLQAGKKVPFFVPSAVRMSARTCVCGVKHSARLRNLATSGACTSECMRRAGRKSGVWSQPNF